MKEKIIRVNSSRVFYRVAGTGKPVIILHGWLSSSRAWLIFQKHLAPRGFKIIIPDLPGFGQSPLSDPRGWGLDDYVQWVQDFIKVLRESKELEGPLTLVGHSFGGRIAIKIAAEKFLPSLHSLILIDAAGLLTQPDLRKKILASIASHCRQYLDTMNISSKLKEKFKILGYRLIRQKDYLRASPELRKTFQKIIGEDLLPLLPKITLPTLIVWGKKDQLLPVSQAYLLQENIPHSKLKIIPNAEHSPGIQTPEKLSEIMFNFLKEHD